MAIAVAMKHALVLKLQRTEAKAKGPNQKQRWKALIHFCEIENIGWLCLLLLDGCCSFRFELTT